MVDLFFNKNCKARGFIFIILMFIVSGNCFLYGQEESRYSFNIKDKALIEVFKEVERNTPYSFFFDDEVGGIEQNIDLNARNKTIHEILGQLSSTLPLEFKISDNVIYVKKISREASPRLITGKIADVQTKESLIGVNIVIKGTLKGTISDANGNFIISVDEPEAVLQFSYVGYKSSEYPAKEINERTIYLIPSYNTLEDVTVIGYGTTLKRDFAGSVSRISEKEMAAMSVVSPDEALQGMVSGVQVTSNSGTPGGGLKVLIRGQRSINSSNEPLYVVDGIPINSGSIENRNLGGETQNLTAGINPNDIASITILKDASSTAIYGARAANGVVLIETKRGKDSDKTAVEINYSYGIGKEVNRYEWLEADQYIELVNESRVNSGIEPVDYGNYAKNDWQEQVFQNAVKQEIQANTRGGSEKTQFYLSGGYYTESGVIINTTYDRYSFRANLNHSINEKLKISSSFSVSKSNSNRQYSNWFGGYGPYASALFAPPVYPTYNQDGSYFMIDGNYNPVANGLESRLENTTTKLLGNINFEYNITKDLVFKTVFSHDYNSLREDHFDGSFTSFARSTVTPAELLNRGFYGSSEVETYNIEPTLSFSKLYNESHKVSTILGSTFQGTSSFLGRVQGYGLGSGDITTYLITASETDGYSNRTDYNFLSYFGRVAYTYNGKYIANLTLRTDGSSRFGQNKRFGTFYAGSLAWNFSDESFLSDVTWLSLGKIRGGYGITGNDQIGDFQYLAAWSSGGAYLDTPGLGPDQIGNPDLSWEETATYDAGLELGFLKDRITLNLGYFYSITSDLLFAIPVTGTTGFQTVTGNLGDIQNKGVEIEASAWVINRNHLNWRIVPNISFIHNEILKLNTDKPIIQTLIPNAIIPGQAINTFYTLNFEGVNVITGEPVYTDNNKDGIITTGDKQILGDAHPDFFGGVTNIWTYKNFSLTAMINFMGGHKIFNLTKWYAEGVSGEYNKPKELLDRWQEPGDKTDVPKVYFGGSAATMVSSRYLSDGDFIRLKNITLGYDIPEGIIRKLNISNLNIYVTGTNLITLTKYDGLDPELNTFNRTGGEINANTWAGIEGMTIPQLRYLIFGTQIIF